MEPKLTELVPGVMWEERPWTVGNLARIAADCYAKNVDLSHLVSSCLSHGGLCEVLAGTVVPLARSSSC